MKITKLVTQGLGGLLATCLVVRVGGWLVQPFIPMLIVLFAVAVIAETVASRRS